LAAIPILCYHNVALAPREARYPGLYVDPRQLARQFDWMKRLGLRGVSLREAVKLLAAPQPAPVVALTFDDGYLDTLENALPLLRSHGFGATCFAVSDALGDHNRWDADFLGERKRLMDRDQLRRWIDAGMEVGSHSRSHPRLPQLDDEAARAEIFDSRAALGGQLGVPVDSFCYPYGACDARVASLVQAAGYRVACGTQPRSARPGDDPFRLPRYLVDGEHGMLRFLHKVARPFSRLLHRAS
jgi:peptidoglycan/xylan/chitin deacetylase (PgdA/CDA1 family)